LVNRFAERQRAGRAVLEAVSLNRLRMAASGARLITGTKAQRQTIISTYRDRNFGPP